MKGRVILIKSQNTKRKKEMKTNKKMNMVMVLVVCSVMGHIPSVEAITNNDIIQLNRKTFEMVAYWNNRIAREEQEKQRKERTIYPRTPHSAGKKSVDGHRVLCRNCKGEGCFSTRCVYCSGTGQVVCSTCNGRGTFAAPGCLPMVCGCNNGMSICWRCTGSGLGSDQIKCKHCDGNGSYFVDD